jgi:hypothetical protein
MSIPASVFSTVTGDDRDTGYDCARAYNTSPHHLIQPMSKKRRGSNEDAASSSSSISSSCRSPSLPTTSTSSVVVDEEEQGTSSKQHKKTETKTAGYGKKLMGIASSSSSSAVLSTSPSLSILYETLEELSNHTTNNENDNDQRNRDAWIQSALQLLEKEGNEERKKDQHVSY